MITRANPDVAVGATSIVQDANGAAAVVELRNRGKADQVELPVAIAVRDKRGRAVYQNNVAGLERSLVSLPLLKKGQRAFWVNNQLPVVGKADAVKAVVGLYAELRARRNALAEEVAELTWDLGGLTYEMAIRDHFRLDVLVRRAAALQERDADLGEVERLLAASEDGVAGGCRSCGAPHGRGATYCWKCGQPLMPQATSTAATEPPTATAGGGA